MTAGLNSPSDYKPMAGFFSDNIKASGIPSDSVVKNPPISAGEAGDMDSIPGSGRSPGGGNGNSLQYTCLGNPMDRSLADYIHCIANSWTWLSN